MNEEIYSAEAASTPPSPEPTPETTKVPNSGPESSEPRTTYNEPAKKSSVAPLFFGFLLVLLVAGLLGTGYYVLKIRSDLSASPTPTPLASLAPSDTPEPSIIPSSTPAASQKPTAPVKKIVTPTSTPTPLSTYDIRFGNPSANVKQTYDDGSGVGRVINREYTSIQAGQFDEVKGSWSPRVSVCFHVVTNETVPGKSVKFSFSLDDKIEVEDNLGQYDQMEAGRIYDWCHDITTSIGKHTAKMLLNGDKSLKEANYVNDLARLDYENLADNIAPNFTLTGPFDWEEKGTCLLVNSPSDNITSISELKVEHKIDGGAWTTLTGAQYCFIGTQGSSHTYSVRITDTRGNKNEQTKTFVLF